MSFFQEMEGEAAVIVSGGIYKQVPLYTRDGYIYAKTLGGFIRLMMDGATSKSKVRVDFLSTFDSIARDTLGRLCLPQVPGSIRLGSPAQPASSKRIKAVPASK